MKKYDKLTEAQKQALYQYMVTDGGVELEEYEAHARKFLYRVVLVKPSTIKRAFVKWGEPGRWDYKKWDCDSEKDRCGKIRHLHQRGHPVWPYIVGGGRTVKGWASDEMNHGDGWHRMCLAVQENRPIEFLFLNLIKTKTLNNFLSETRD